MGSILTLRGNVFKLMKVITLKFGLSRMNVLFRPAWLHEGQAQCPPTGAFQVLGRQVVSFLGVLIIPPLLSRT